MPQPVPTNPYAPPQADLDVRPTVAAGWAVIRISRGFLKRDIEVDGPTPFRLTYSARSPIERVTINGAVVAKLRNRPANHPRGTPLLKAMWSLLPRFDFVLPFDGSRVGCVEIRSSWGGFAIAAFRVSLDGVTIYSEGAFPDGLPDR